MLGKKIYKPIDTVEKCNAYSSLAEWCNANGATIEDKGEFYEVVSIPAPTLSEEDLLMAEKAELEAWLKAHDYIGVKIATGRATIDDYADEIALMTEKAERINEIDALLK